MEKVTLGGFLPGDSAAHRLDPRAKAVMLLFLAVGVMAGHGLRGAGVVALPALLAAVLIRLDPRLILRGMKPFLWLIGLTVVLHLALAQSAAEGLDAGLTYGARLFLIIWFSTLFTLTTSPLDLIRGFRKTFGPLARVGLPVDELALMLLIFIRMLPIIDEEGRRIAQAQKVRLLGDEPDTWSFRIKKVKAILIPLFYNTLRRVEGLAVAVSMRGLGSHEKSRVLKEMRFRFADYLGLGLAAVVAYLGARL